MSGTTAFSSFSMVEAESLDPDDIRDQLPNLYDTATKFLKYLVPEDGHMEIDDGNIQELQRSGSKYRKGYKRHGGILETYLQDFKTEQNTYIRPRAIHRALRPNRDPSEPQFGVDLILYLANLLIFTHKIILSDRDEGAMWDFLRELDRSFPQHFIPKIASGVLGSGSGESTLLKETFELALELRTHLAILWLEIAGRGPNFDAEDTLNEVFYRTDSEEPTPIVRGWQVPGLDDDDLSRDQRSKIEARVEEIRSFFTDMDSLGDAFPWNSLILQLLQWVRLRHRELQTAIEGVGGVDAIAGIVKNNSKSPVVSRKSPRKARTSFTKERRRVSGKFNVHDASKDAIVDALIASSRVAAAQPAAQEVPAPVVEPVGDKGTDLTTLVNDDGDEHNIEEPLPKAPSETDLAPTLNEDVDQPEIEAHVSQEISESGPPESTADYVKIITEMQKTDKENRGMDKTNQRSFFERQPTAERIEFGDGFDASQATPGPSRKGKEPEQAASKKRGREVAEDSSDEEDDFEIAQSSLKARERRPKAPVKKRVRIEAAPSATPSDQPPNHQPPTRRSPARTNVRRQIVREQSSHSEAESPDMTEEPPRKAPRYSELQSLAKRNQRALAMDRAHKPRTFWTPQAEEAFLEYMEMFPHKYSIILEHDAGEGYFVLQDRTQINLKDKARTMAINMIK
jgi:hypothetical protein